MRRLLVAILLTCAGLIALSPGTAQAADPVETWANFDTGECLTHLVTGSAPHLHHRLRLLTCDGEPRQAWTEVPGTSPTTFQLVADNGWCFVPSGATVGFADCAADPAQYWVKQKLGNGTVRLINVGTGLVLGRDNLSPSIPTLYSPNLFAPSVMWKPAAA